MRSWWLLAVLAACGKQETSGDDGTTETGTTPSLPTGDTGDTRVTTPTTPTGDTGATTTPGACDGAAPVVTRIDATPRLQQVHTVDLAIDLDVAAPVAVRCERRDRPSEVLLVESDAATSHLLPVRGLAGDTDYDCDVVATCPPSQPRHVSFRTMPLRPTMPEVTIGGSGQPSTAPPFLLVGHDRHCVGDAARMLLFDTDGVLRWAWDGVPDIDVAYETQYLGGGTFTWGGGYYDRYPPQIVDVDGNVLFEPSTPNTTDRFYHHDGKLLADGRLLALTVDRVSDGTRSWDGFGVSLVDPATNTDVYRYSSQTAVDDGDLPGGNGDVWHANWADVIPEPGGGERLYVSLCFLGQVLAIDAASQHVAWTFGEGGDFTVVDPAGDPVEEGLAWPQCQHGLEFEPRPGGGGGKLLVYDNGAHGRGWSRLVQYDLDEATHVATMDWSWTEPHWYEPQWGDVDWLPGGHVLATEAHSCHAPEPGDVSSVVEVDPLTGDVPWRMDFTDPNDAIYRAERVDACDLIGLAGACPAVDARLAELADVFDPCGNGGAPTDDDNDGVSSCAGDCDDLDPTVHAGAAETCDGRDEDCDGEIDEDFARTAWFPDVDGDGAGGGDGVLACAAPPDTIPLGGDCNDGDPAIGPQGAETCDGVDDDCDGAVDELPSCWSCAATGPVLVCDHGLPWADARQVCQDLGGDLVFIHSELENRAVAQLSAPGTYWVGLTDTVTEGTFRWVDGTPATYTSWYRGEPNDAGGDEDCVSINYGGDGKWNDYRCSGVQPFVCRL
ncbi:MAG: aryl-sulfate sulfotransferase [Alphaproteobacteria bacterium]|nr:aryl-sulfate sulfotransferase [Alphaproteobacteria bacterium]